MDAHLICVTDFKALQSGTSWDSSEHAARSDTWKLDTPTNYFRFSFAVEAGYQLDIERIGFDYKSEKIMSIAFGTNKYDVRMGLNGNELQGLSGGGSR